jgi:hypothetical protein
MDEFPTKQEAEATAFFAAGAGSNLAVVFWAEEPAEFLLADADAVIGAGAADLIPLQVKREVYLPVLFCKLYRVGYEIAKRSCEHLFVPIKREGRMGLHLNGDLFDACIRAEGGECKFNQLMCVKA